MLFKRPSERSISAHKKHANLQTICHTCNSHKHKHIASTQHSLKTPPIRGIIHPLHHNESAPSSPHAPPTAKEIKPSTSPANPSQALLQATPPYYQPLPSLPKAPPLQAHRSNHHMKTVAASPALYFTVLRHRTLSPTIYLTEVIRKPFALSQTFFLSSGGKSILLVKKKAPSRSGFSLSTHVVLKTWHANPNIHVRRY